MERYPCSPGQQALWFEQSLAPDSAAYHVALSAEIIETFDEDRFIRSLLKCTEDYSILKSSFQYSEGKVSYSISSQCIPFIDRIAIPSDADQRILDSLTSAYRASFNMENGPLIRLHIASTPSGRKFILLVIHHLVCDAWSLRTIFETIVRYYCNGNTQLQPLGVSTFDQYVNDQNTESETQRRQQSQHYWKNALAGCADKLTLATDFIRPAQRELHGRTLHMELSKEQYEGLFTLSKTVGVTPYTVLLTAFGYLLSQYGGADDFCIGSPVMSRMKKSHLGVVGYCMNPVLIRISIDYNDTVAESLKKNFTVVRSSLSYKDYPLPFVINDCGFKRVPGY